MWKPRHYGKGYIYDRLHRGAVGTLMSLTALSFIFIFATTLPSAFKSAPALKQAAKSEEEESQNAM